MSSTVRIEVSALDVNMAVFRDWEDLPREVFEMVGNRTVIGNLLIYKFHHDILKRGYTIVDAKDNVQHEKEMTKQLVKDINEKYAKARKAKKQYGISVLSYYKFEDNKEDKQLYWLEDTHIFDMDVKSGTKELKQLSFVPPFYDKIVIDNNAINVDAKDLKYFRLLADYDTKINTYRSWLEPIADRLIGWAVLFQQLTLLEIRDGSGIRYMLAPASYLSNAEKRREYEEILENMGYNLLLALPNDSEIGKNVEFGIKFSEGQSALDFPAALDMLLVPIALHTGLSKEYLKGNEMGLRSSEKNRQKSNDAEVQEQEDMEADLLWIWGNILNCDKCLEGSHLINYETKIELDETEKLANDQIAFKILSETPWEKLGVEMEDALEYLGIDIATNPQLREEFKRAQEELRSSISKGSTDDGDQADGSDEDDNNLQGSEE